MLDRNMALKAIPKANVAALPHAKFRAPNNERSTTGRSVRRWWATNTPSSANPAAVTASVRVESHPQSSPLTMPSVTRTVEMTRSAGPAAEGTTAAGSRDSVSTRRPIATMSAPTGTFTRNTQRQPPVSTRAAPSVGPTAPATAPVAPQMASVTGIRSRGVDRSTSAREDGTSAAAPNACSTLAITRAVGPGATAQRTDAAVKTTAPSRKVRRCPRRSASLPKGISSAANMIV